MLKQLRAVSALCLVCGVAWSPKSHSQENRAPVKPVPDEASFKRSVKPFFEQHCVRCHGAEKKQGKFALHGFGSSVAVDREGYAAVLERLLAGDMPPDGEAKPTAEALRAVTAWIQAGLDAKGQSDHPSDRPVRPNEGNRVPHVLLFGTPAVDSVPPAPRLWRVGPRAYSERFVQDLKANNLKSLSQPFDLIAEPGIKDYSQLYSVDGASTEVLLRNAQLIVENQTKHAFDRGANGAVGRVVGVPVSEFAPLLHPTVSPNPSELDRAIRAQYRMALVREPSDDELLRMRSLYEKNLKVADRAAAARFTLMAPLLMPEAIYRYELGRGKEVRSGVRTLAPKEIAFALSLAMSNQRDPALFVAAEKGALTNKDQVAAQVRRMLDDPTFPKPRLLGFFREYFGYDGAVDVFKDRPDDHIYHPHVLVSDTDRLVLWVLDRDKEVFKELLTTKKTFANYSERIEKGKVVTQPLKKPHPPNDGKRAGPEFPYGVGAWPETQPVEMSGNRMGILMQPSWLVAWSGNFENDPVRRARWIRERLLGGLVPDLPIDVAAKVPDEPDQTLRHRLRVTREAACWKCHQKMDDLGLPFEGFNHYGAARTAETVRDLATAKTADKKGKPLAVVLTNVPLNTAGAITASGEPSLDGPVKDAAELVRKLAASERARQVFVRHVFRYYMGRNETPGDAMTLQDADKAYVKSGGSFKALLVSLLSSESFLYRSVPAK